MIFHHFRGQPKRRVSYFFELGLPITVGLAENPSPPWYFAALPGSFLATLVLLHAFARGLVLFAIMPLLRIVPSFAQFCRACGFFFFCTADAFLHSARRLSAASIAWRSPPLGVGSGRREEG